jgi:hypothetical protein
MLESLKVGIDIAHKVTQNDWSKEQHYSGQQHAQQLAAQQAQQAEQQEPEPETPVSPEEQA